MYVYRFLNKENKIIYIGRAKDLKNRLSSHNHLPNICYTNTVKVEYILLNNNDESAIYERYLINKYNPKHNREYKNKSNFSFELPEKEWKNYDFKFKQNSVLKDEHFNIEGDIIKCNQKFDINGYLIFSDLGDIDDEEYKLFKILIASSFYGLIILKDNDDYSRESMLNFIKYMVNSGIIKINYEIYNNNKIANIVFEEDKLFGESFSNYKYFKNMTEEDKIKLFNIK